MIDPRRPRRIRTHTVLSWPHIQVHEHELDEPEGRRIVTIDLLDWVNVVTTDLDGNFVFVEQHRHGIDAPTIECAAGVVDPGEDHETAARRELLEETGYEAGSLEPLGWIHPNPALHGNRSYFFLARNATRKAAPLNPPEEQTSVRILSREETHRAIAEHRITHAMTVVALRNAFDLLDGPRAIGVDAIERCLGAMRDHEVAKLVELARRLKPGLTFEDIKQPHDFPELADPDFHFADGTVAGIEAALIALRALARESGG